MIKEILLHTINTDRKDIKNYTFGLAVMFAFFSIIGTSIYDMDGDGDYDISYNSVIGLIQFMIILMFVFASPNWIFKFRKTRPATIQYLMLPASNLEKFISKMIFSYVVYLLMCLVAVMLADVVQAAFHFFLYNEAKSITKLLLLEKNLIFVAGMYKDLSYNACFAIWVHSIYTLGASFFRTHSFIKTSGIMFVLTILYNGFIAQGTLTLPGGADDIFHLITDNEDTVDILYFTIIPLLAICNYYLSYLRFCKMSVLI